MYRTMEEHYHIMRKLNDRETEMHQNESTAEEFDAFYKEKKQEALEFIKDMNEGNDESADITYEEYDLSNYYYDKIRIKLASDNEKEVPPFTILMPVIVEGNERELYQFLKNHISNTAYMRHETAEVYDEELEEFYNEEENEIINKYPASPLLSANSITFSEAQVFLDRKTLYENKWKNIVPDAEFKKICLAVPEIIEREMYERKAILSAVMETLDLDKEKAEFLMKDITGNEYGYRYTNDMEINREMADLIRNVDKDIAEEYNPLNISQHDMENIVSDMEDGMNISDALIENGYRHIALHRT